MTPGAGLVCALMVATASVADAGSSDSCSGGTPVSEAAKRKARRLNDLGMKALEAKRYERALALFREAYKTDCTYTRAMTNAASTVGRSARSGRGIVDWEGVDWEGGWAALGSALQRAPARMLGKIEADPDLQIFSPRRWFREPRRDSLAGPDIETLGTVAGASMEVRWVRVRPRSVSCSLEVPYYWSVQTDWARKHATRSGLVPCGSTANACVIIHGYLSPSEMALVGSSVELALVEREKFVPLSELAEDALGPVELSTVQAAGQRATRLIWDDMRAEMTGSVRTDLAIEHGRNVLFVRFAIGYDRYQEGMRSTEAALAKRQSRMLRSLRCDSP
ncbi:MAG: hypothetical protein IPK13_28115 [Deltaproteobacteria bacterium]|nr:hypothetical protein [Deltaproteobacteria bacterium]